MEKHFFEPNETSRRAQLLHSAITVGLQKLNEENQELFHKPHEIYGVVIVGSYARAIQGEHASLHPSSDLDYFTLATTDPGDQIDELFDYVKEELARFRLKLPAPNRMGVIIAPPVKLLRYLRKRRRYGKQKEKQVY